MLFSSLRSCPPSPLSLLVLCICSLVCPSRAPDQKTSATCRRNRGGRNCKANWTTSTRTFRKRWTRGIIENKYSLTTKSEDRTDLSAASSQGRSHQDERRVHKESSDGRPCQRGPPVNRNRPEYREAPVWSSKIWGEFCVLASRERKSWENHKFQPRCAAPLAQPPILGEEVMQPDTCLHAQSCDTLLHPFTSAQLRFFLWKSSCLRMSFFFFWLVQGWLAEVEERMPSKSDVHRRSGLYETQNSTTVSNNCAQDRERYGMLRTTAHTHTVEDITHVHGMFTVCVLAFEQPGRQLHRGAEFRDSGQSRRQSHIHHARLRRRVWWRRVPAHYWNLQSLVPIWRFNVFNVSPPHTSWSWTLFLESVV